MKTLIDNIKAYGAQVFIAFDQAVNAIFMPLITWSIGYADETLSARAWRMHVAKRFWGRVLMPLIDWLFAWQSPDPEIRDAAGDMIRGHCERAFRKEQLRRGLPPAYREGARDSMNRTQP